MKEKKEISPIDTFGLITLAKLFYELARTLYAEARFEEAINYINKSIEYNTNNEVSSEDISILLAALLVELKKPELAITSLLTSFMGSEKTRTSALLLFDQIKSVKLTTKTRQFIEHQFLPLISNTNLQEIEYARLYRFLGDIYDIEEDGKQAINFKKEAALKYHNLGKSNYWDNKFTEALDLFRQAKELDPELEANYWYMADTCYILSFTQKRPFFNKEILDEAKMIWDSAFETYHPLPDFAWVYQTRGRIEARYRWCEKQFNNDTHRKALIFYEAALLFDPKNYFRLQPTAECFNDLAMENNGLLLATRAVENNDKDANSLAEQVRSSINTGYFAEAIRGINRLYSLDPAGKNTYKGWEAYINYARGEYEKALALLSEKSDDYDEWSLSLEMSIHWITGNMEKAKECARRTFEFADKNSHIMMNPELALGSLVLGDIKKAREIIGSLVLNEDFQPQTLMIGVLIELSDGNIAEASNYFSELIKMELRVPEITEIINILKGLRSNLEKQEFASREFKLPIEKIGEFIGLLNVKTPKQLNASSPILLMEEIDNALVQDKNYKPGTIGRVALSSSKARLFLEQKKFQDAIQLYAQLVDSRSAGYPLFWNDLIPLIKSYVTSISDYRLMQNSVQALLASDKANNLRSPMKELMLQLDHGLASLLGLSNKMNEAELQRPIAVEMDDKLIPPELLTGKMKDSDWEMINRYIPEMRSAVLKEYGITLPGIRIRSNETGDLANGGYMVLLNEVPIRLGYVKNDSFFTFDNPDLIHHSIPMKSVFQEKLPFSFSEGCWIDKSFKDEMVKMGLKVYEPFEIILLHVKAIISRNFEQFFGFEQASNLIDQWSKGAERKQKLDELFKDNESVRKIRFTKVLRELLNARVPLIESDSIINSLLESGLNSDNVLEDVLKVRSNLARLVPFNISEFERLTLKEDLEAKARQFLIQLKERITVAAEPEDVQNWLSDFREYYEVKKEELKKGAVVVTDDAKSRIAVNKLLDLEFPDLPVLTEDEWKRTIETEEKQEADKSVSAISL